MPRKRLNPSPIQRTVVQAATLPRGKPIQRTSRTGRALQQLALHDSLSLMQIREHLRTQQYGDVALPNLRREVGALLVDHGFATLPRRDHYTITDAGRAQVLAWREEPPASHAPRKGTPAARGGFIGQPAPASAVQGTIAHQAQHVRGPHLGGIGGGAAGDDCSHRFVRQDGLQHQQLPSRRGNKLYYRDGRVEDITHAAQAPHRPQLGMPGAAIPRATAPANDATATPSRTPRRRITRAAA